MDLSFESSNLEQLATKSTSSLDLSPAVIAVFRRKLQMLLAANTKASLKNLRSMQFLPLKGNKNKLFFVKLTDDWRLILSFLSEKHVKIIGLNKSGGVK